MTILLIDYLFIVLMFCIKSQNIDLLRRFIIFNVSTKKKKNTFERCTEESNDFCIYQTFCFACSYSNTIFIIYHDSKLVFLPVFLLLIQ